MTWALTYIWFKSPTLEGAKNPKPTSWTSSTKHCTVLVVLTVSSFKTMTRKPKPKLPPWALQHLRWLGSLKKSCWTCTGGPQVSTRALTIYIHPDLQFSPCTVLLPFSEQLWRYSSVPELQGWQAPCISLTKATKALTKSTGSQLPPELNIKPTVRLPACMPTLKRTEFQPFSIHSQHFFDKTYMTCFSCRAPREMLRCTGLAKVGPSPPPRGSGTSSPFRSPLYEFDGLWFSFTEPEEKHDQLCPTCIQKK